MEDLVVLTITVATLGQTGLCLSLLLARSVAIPVYIPLAIFFLANGVMVSGPIFFTLIPVWSTYYIAAIFPAWFLMGPSLWLYVQGLTADTPWRLHKRQLYHLLPFALGLMVMGQVLSLSPQMRQAIFIEGVDVESGFPLLVVISVFVSMLLWIAQSGFYITKIVVRLARYRKQLKDLFSSNEHRELGWLSWLLLIIVGSWLLVLANFTSDLAVEKSLVSDRIAALVSLIVVWSLAHWGLRQKPGFAGQYLLPDQAIDQTIDQTTYASGDASGKSAPPAGEKYQRSALEKTQAERIAEKINTAMVQDKLHLDPSLSLQKLAQHLAISPNYISQTLNETLGANFFDFVNRWRIETAKPKIIANEDTVLNIAYQVGFNARSSFYKVFKKETGKTPSEYRKLYCAQTE